MSVEFNIDGKIFKVAKTALKKKYRGSLFAKLAADPNALKEDGVIMIDRSNRLWPRILSYLNDGTLPLERAAKVELLEEAKFYDLEDLIDSLEKDLVNNPLQYFGIITPFHILNCQGAYLFWNDSRKTSWSFYLSFKDDGTVSCTQGTIVTNGAWEYRDGVVYLEFPAKEIGNCTVHFMDASFTVLTKNNTPFLGKFYGMETLARVLCRGHRSVNFNTPNLVPIATQADAKTHSFLVEEKRIEFTSSTLAKFPNSLFSKLVQTDSTFTNKKNKKGEILITREATYLEYVVNFMKNGELPIAEPICRKVAEEADFYGLEELIEAMKTDNKKGKVRLDGKNM